MVAKLVEERPEEGPVGDDLAPFGRQHPHRDARAAATIGRLVKALQLAAVERWTTSLDANDDRRNAECTADALRELLRDHLDRAGAPGCERRR